jgi:hypothetical protein
MQKTALLALVTALLWVLALPARAESPPAPTTAQPAPTAKVQLLRLEGPIPESWIAQAPSSSMRLAQYEVPGSAGAEPGEFVAYFFGAGQGGSAEANIERWTSQFSKPEGGPVEPKLSKFEVEGMQVTSVELQGSYARGVGMGPEGAAKPDQTLLAAIVGSPEGNLYLQLYGPTKTVSEWRGAFEQLLRGLHPSADQGGT